MPLYYFAYGANMDAADLAHRCTMHRRTTVRFISSKPAMLRGYRLAFNVFCRQRGTGILNLIPDAKARIYGVLHGLPAGDVLSTRDLAEGEPRVYRIHMVMVETAGGKEVPAAVLMADVRSRTLFRPTEAYIRLVAAAARRHRLPSSWIERLESFSTAPEGTAG